MAISTFQMVTFASVWPISSHLAAAWWQGTGPEKYVNTFDMTVEHGSTAVVVVVVAVVVAVVVCVWHVVVVACVWLVVAPVVEEQSDGP